MTSTRKSIETKTRHKKPIQDDLAFSPNSEEKLKRSIHSVATPRNYLAKSSTTDIYARKPKKSSSTPRYANVSPMKDLLKSSPSTSQISRSSKAKSTIDLKASRTPQTVKNTPRKPALSNVTVNSPVARRRLYLEDDDHPIRTVGAKEKRTDQKNMTTPSKTTPKDPLPSRQRTKTRTLDDEEVKILTPHAIGNSAAMQNMSRKLAVAKPKAFFVDLDEKSKGSKSEPEKQNIKSSEEDEVSYEDDFESYESDFDSYHSEAKTDGSATLSEESNAEDDQMDKKEEVTSTANSLAKDEEKMLDSGNFDLRESQRSASRKPGMDFILEGSEVGEDKKASLTDEGFQEMSSSSAASSMRIHTDVLERPLFIDFTKSKENKRKRKIVDKLRQRAKDILSMVTLHEMSYSLFEMTPVPYDLYMATFGRKNYTQTAIQTFEDGITEEVQTDEVLCDSKWTQFPVEFSTNDITRNQCEAMIRENNEPINNLRKFSFLLNLNNNLESTSVSEAYKRNPLRIYLEQKDGAGSDHMMPETVYKFKLKNNDFNLNKLRKFLNKSESRISNLLSLNAGTKTINLIKATKFPLSKGYLNISTKNITDETFKFLKYTKTIGVAISETKDNLIMTYHKKSSSTDMATKCFICLWDTSIAISEPLKVLKATDNVTIGRFRGNTNGIFVAALEDCELHLWDLSEEPTWYNDVASYANENEKATKLVEVDTSRMSQIEIDREWNLRNSEVVYEVGSQCTMQVSAYTSSAVNMVNKDPMDSIVGLEFIGDSKETIQENGRKILGQICSLKRLGIIILWSIIQETTTGNDIGKAYWSKIKLQKNQTLNLSEHLDLPITDSANNFNLNAAKRRLSNRKHERIERKKEITRSKSAIFKNVGRPNSVASPRRSLPVSSNINDWDSTIICNHLKVLRLNKIDNYLVAKNNGEVLCCKRNMRDCKVDRLFVASDKSSIVKIEVTYSNLPYFLAATESGTVNLCSILDARVLLTLDCRNGPPITADRCQSDSKGRFVASVPAHSTTEDLMSSRSNMSIKSVSWSTRNPFRVLALLKTGRVIAWELTRSDMRAASVLDTVAVDSCSSQSDSLALITPEEVQVHRLSSEDDDKGSVELFKKYVALL